MKQVPSQKHHGVYLDTKLNFQEHLNNVLSKENKTIGLLRNLEAFLPSQSVVTVYQTFIRPHLDYGDIIYYQTYNDSFHQKMKSIQYNATLATTGAIRGTSKEKLYQELDLESLRKRRWYRKTCYFFKYLKVNLPSISSDYFLTLAKHIIQELMIRFPSSVVNITFYKFFFSINCH